MAPVVDKARTFDGGNDFFYRADNDVFSPGAADFSWTAWVYFNSVGNYRHLISKYRASGSNREYLIRLNNDSRMAFYASTNGTTNLSHIASNFGALSATTWYFICARHQNGGTIEISVNDTDETGTAFTGGIHEGTAQFELGVLEGQDGPSLHHAGRLYGVRLWDTYLSDATREILYNSGTPLRNPSSGNIVAEYLLNEDSGDAIDSVGSLDLTGVSAPGSADGPF
jgi:hypothetical protein